MKTVCETKPLKVSVIKSKNNSRAEMDPDAIANLMSSIKQDGLLQPIGVTKNGKGYDVVWGNRRFEAIKKLGLKTIECKIVEKKSKSEYFILNLVENIQRSDISTIEQGRFINELKKMGLATREIAARLSITPSRVAMLGEAFKTVPKQFRSKISVRTGTSGFRKGTIPLTHVAQISSLRRQLNLSKKNVNDLYSVATQDDFNKGQMLTFAAALKEGDTKEEAMRSIKKCSTITMRFTIDNKVKAKLVRKYKKQMGTILRDIITGKIKEKVKHSVT